MAGYSDTPLAKKLGIKPASRILPRGAPANYIEIVGPLPGGAALVSRLTPTTDIVHLFCTTKRELQSQLQELRFKLRQDGAVWVSWPKRSAKVATEVTEDTIREIALPLGFVDIKVCAVDAVWSGLKLVIRREHRLKT